MTPNDILYTPMLIAAMVKWMLIPLTKMTFPGFNWTPTKTRMCVYIWSLLLSLFALYIGCLGPISPASLWVGLSSSLVAGTGSIGLHESVKKTPKDPKDSE